MARYRKHSGDPRWTYRRLLTVSGKGEAVFQFYSKIGQTVWLEPANHAARRLTQHTRYGLLSVSATQVVLYEPKGRRTRNDSQESTRTGSTRTGSTRKR